MKTRLLLAGAICSFLILLSGTTANAATWYPLTTNGFGDEYNETVYPGGVFNDMIFIGTNHPYGGEIWYSSEGSSFSLSTEGGMGDSANMTVQVMPEAPWGDLFAHTYNNNGAEIWKSETGLPGSWTQVQVNGSSYNGLDGGTDNVALWGWSNDDGTVFMGTENNGTNGCEVWYTPDGINWTRNATGSVDFGCNSHTIAIPGPVFGTRIFCGTFRSYNYGSSLFCRDELVGATVYSSDWTTKDTGGFGDTNNDQVILSPQSFGDQLYAGTMNDDTGCEIWRTEDGETWEQVNEDGFGDPNNWEITSFCIPGDGYIYAATSNSSTGGEIWRSEDGETWEKVEGTEGGFGDAHNTSVYLSMGTYNDHMYAGTHNYNGGGHLYMMSIEGEPPVDPNTKAEGQDEEIQATKAGEIVVVGSTEREGVINPDKGDPIVVDFRGKKPGKYTLRIFTMLGELVYDETKSSISGGRFSWIPKNLASGIYIAHVEGPGLNIQKKIAIIR
ncbi:MAG: T9SS type A sorting domain-containing protein [Elusimicrobia bacterium]|nr:T9SS type A sorting domain-containing protein [Elusimicrobiota bacterium]